MEDVAEWTYILIVRFRSDFWGGSRCKDGKYHISLNVKDIYLCNIAILSVRLNGYKNVTQDDEEYSHKSAKTVHDDFKAKNRIEY